MEGRFLLWKATGDSAHLTEARSLLQFALDHTDPAHRDTMTKSVPLHRDILLAAQKLASASEGGRASREHGGADSG